MTFSHNELLKIPHTLSEPRFATYLQHCNNDKMEALKLYRWNLEISSALVIPIHFLEISLRNAAVERLDIVHTPNWARNNGFIQALPNPKKGYSPRTNLQAVARQQPTAGKIVAELKFVFWEKLFTSRHDVVLWNKHINNIFPFAPKTLTTAELRSQIHDDTFIIRKLRNRISHHEPIFTRNLQEDYEKIKTLVSWRDDSTAAWMENTQTVTRLITEKP